MTVHRIRECGQLRGDIDNRLPSHDLLGNFCADSLHCAQIGAARGQDLLGRFENLQQFAQSDWADRREHVECDAGFRGVHAEAASRRLAL